jgi:hypothetical protein
MRHPGDGYPAQRRDVYLRGGQVGEEGEMSLTDDDKRWITEQLERVETALLTEFHKWASPIDARQRSHSAALRALDVEMEAINDRLRKIEPPQ